MSVLSVDDAVGVADKGLLLRFDVALTLPQGLLVQILGQVKGLLFRILKLGFLYLHCLALASLSGTSLLPPVLVQESCR